MHVSSSDARRYFMEIGSELLAVTADHAVAVKQTDRMWVARALAEPKRLMTHDPTVARYGVTIIRV